MVLRQEKKKRLKAATKGNRQGQREDKREKETQERSTGVNVDRVYEYRVYMIRKKRIEQLQFEGQFESARRRGWRERKILQERTAFSETVRETKVIKASSSRGETQGVATQDPNAF